MSTWEEAKKVPPNSFFRTHSIPACARAVELQLLLDYWASSWVVAEVHFFLLFRLFEQSFDSALIHHTMCA